MFSMISLLSVGLLSGVLLISALAPIDAAAEASMPASATNLVPLPVRQVAIGEAFVIGPKTQIVATSQPKVADVAKLLAHDLRLSTGYSLPIVAFNASKPLHDAIILSTGSGGTALGAEGYLLQVTPTLITIRAPQPAGLFYGTETLRQLLPPQVCSPTVVNGVAWKVPGVRISDKPRFSYRGFMLDSSRHIQTVSFIKRTLNLMAFHKLNTLHWHLTDDQGWRIEIKRYPRLTEVGAWRDENGQKYGGFFTQDEIRDIVKYAAERFITIIPEIDMPGHSRAAIESYPDLGCSDSRWSNVMCPGKESTYQFVDGMLTEVMDLFPSHTIHLGGDEVETRQWRNSPDCQKLMKQEHLTSEAALQNYFTRRVAGFLQSHGRRLQGWDEIINGGGLPKSVVVQSWNNPAASATAAKAGNDVVVSLTKYAYFDYSYDTTNLARVYSYEPMPDGLTAQQAKHILGPEACLWTETKPTDAVADEYIWPRLIALAEVAWSPASSRNWDGFKARLLNAHYERLAQMGLGAQGTGDGIRQALIDRSDFDTGTQVGAWDPSQVSQDWKAQDWDVTSFLHKPGDYRLRLNYVSGADGIDVSSVALLQDGKQVAIDTHDAFAGGSSHDNSYRFNLPKYDAKAHYTMRINLRGDGGTDSNGVLYLAGPLSNSTTL